jgi:hypothetical protein
MNGMGRLRLLAIAGVLAAGAQEVPVGPGRGIDDTLLTLARIKNHMGANLLNLPNYTCQQTTERSLRRPPRRRYELIDTLRLEVALVGGKELYSWPGERSFEDRNLQDLVGGGTTGTGAYALHARSVFLSNVPRIHFGAREDLRGGPALRYDFVVPQFRSGYKLKVGDAEAIVGYHGSFWADENSLDVLRLEVVADDVPPFLPVTSASDRIDYRRVRIGAGSFLLPEQSELVLTDLAGNENRNLTHFSNCRQYAGESVISFDDPPDETEAPKPVEWLVLPEGLSLEMVLETPVVPGKAATGDLLTAVLLRDAKRKGEVVVPRGARVTGRFLGARKIPGRVTRMLFTLEFNELEFANRRADLNARLETAGPLAAAGSRVEAVQEREPAGDTSRAMVIVQGTRLELARGLRMVWRTISQSDLE